MYKRQVEGYSNFDPAHDDDRYEPTELMRERNTFSRPLEPVSYTHLDVYKRQVRSDGVVNGCVNLGWGVINVAEELGAQTLSLIHI